MTKDQQFPCLGCLLMKMEKDTFYVAAKMIFSSHALTLIVVEYGGLLTHGVSIAIDVDL